MKLKKLKFLKTLLDRKNNPPQNYIISLFGSVVELAFDQISNFFFFAKIECGLYFFDRFDVLISKIIFKK